MTPVLHEHALSPYAQKIRIALREKGLPFESRMPDALGTGRDPGGYARLNPRVEVPALQDGGTVVYDSTVILHYVEERWPEPPLLPPDPAGRARARTIEEVFDTHWEAVNWGLGEVRFFGRGGDALGPTLRAGAAADLQQLYAWLERRLGGARWLGGEAFGWADACAFPFVTMSDMFGLPPPAGSGVAGWLARGMERASVALTVEEARATLPFMETLLALVAAGAFKRHVRDHRLEWMIRAGGINVLLDGLAADDVRFTDLGRFGAG